MGYRLQPSSEIGGVRLDAHACRTEGRKTYDLVALVRSGLDQAPRWYAQLANIRATLGANADYALALPPVPEFQLIQFLTSDKGWWFYELKKVRFMMWLCNPGRNTVSCVVGGPRDRLFESYFLHGYHPIDPYISTLLSKELMKDEDFQG